MIKKRDLSQLAVTHNAFFFITFLSGIFIGFLAGIIFNGHPRLIFAYEATNHDLGVVVNEKLQKYINGNSLAPLPVGDVLGFLPEKICIQPPYMLAAETRTLLGANLVGFRMAADTENVLWVVDSTPIAKYISVNRLSLADLVTESSASRCAPGKSAVLRLLGSTNEKRLVLEERE